MFKTWDRKSRRLLIERLEMYIAAGMPAGVALSHSGQGLKKKQLRSLEGLCSHIESGQSLSILFGREIGYPSAVVGIIACGESAGSLSESLRSAHALLEREEELMKKCLSAMTYPAVIGVAAVILTLGLIRGIMPQIIPLLTGLHTDLPFLTRAVIKASDLLTLYGAQGGLGLLVCSGMAIYGYHRAHRIRCFVHAVVLHTPLIGSLAEKYALAVFFQSLGALAESGMPADAAYEKSVGALALLSLRKKLSLTIKDVARGESFGVIFRNGLPSYIAPLIAAGEASGSLASAFSRTAAILDRELDHSLKRMTALIEPIMMIFMGGMVGCIALSIMMPIYDISKTLQH